ncbi:hypothetical protein [Mucilaginibacter sp. FT3.2]|uniref:hypothetical protein n=1 Tax=Mucilaginibacter sp. FT3.2 TaxID=2723090 RepID=UPI001608006B|nr:hypothetical protein [Mucilaginibacter sp. FT3.2]MBB6232263.1 hypothetical protein [Mucilaginibacter sp. FT3.2]
MLLNTILNLIASSIFSGTILITLCLIVVNLSKAKLAKIDKPTLIKAINTILLLGAMIYAVMWVRELFAGYFSGGEYEQYTFANRLFGSYWWAALTLLTRNILLPQILWIGRFRSSFISTIAVVSFWLFVYIIAQMPFGIGGILRGFRISTGYLEGLGIYIVLLVSVYLILNRKKLKG